MLERKDNYLLNAVLRRYFRWAALALAAAPVLVLGNPAAAQDETVVSSTRVPAITLPAGTKITSFDFSFVDPVIGLYLLADRTNAEVQVVDTYTNTLLTPYTATPPFAGPARVSTPRGQTGCSR